MSDDFISTLVYAGFTARIKRLSDSLIYDARKFYEHFDADIEPNWHLIFLLLKEYKALTVTEIASYLQFSHPGIIKIIAKMKTKGYVESAIDKNDNRRHLITLTQKSLDQLPHYEKKWDQVQQTIQEFVSETFMHELAIIEDKLGNKSFLDRCLIKTNKTHG